MTDLHDLLVALQLWLILAECKNAPQALLAVLAEIAPGKDVLQALLAGQVIALSAGYPLIFQAMGFARDVPDNRQLKERFANCWQLEWLKCSAFCGIVLTTMALVIDKIEFLKQLQVVFACILPILFLATMTILLCAMTVLVKFAVRPWRLALELDPKAPPCSKNRCCIRLRVTRPPSIANLTKAWRKDLTFITAQVRNLSQQSGYDEEIRLLTGRLATLLGRESMNALTDFEGQRAPEAQDGPVSRDTSIDSLSGDVLDILERAYWEAVIADFESARDAIDQCLFGLLLEHTRYKPSTTQEWNATESIVRNILITCENLVQKAIKRDEVSNITIALTWYNDIVFRKETDEIELRYLPILDRFIASTAKILSACDHAAPINIFLRYLFTGPSFRPIDSEITIEQPFLSDDNCRKAREKFFRKAQTAYSIDDFQSILQDAREGLLNDPQNTKLAQLLKAHAIGWVKLNHLREVFFDVGAWCLRENRYDFLVHLWEFHQPPNASGGFGENYLLPSAPDEILRHYLFVRSPHERNLNFILSWGGRVGKGVWFRRYILLHLLAALEGRFQRPGWNTTSSHEESAKEFVEDLTPGDIAFVKDSTEDLRSAYKDLSLELLDALGFRANDCESFASNKLDPVLKAFSHAAEEKLERSKRECELDDDRVIKFLDEVSSGFENRIGIAHIAKLAGGLCSEGNNTITVKQSEWGWMKREHFIQDWHVDSTGIGTWYGEQAGLGAQFQVLHTMANLARRKSFQDFIDLLSKSASSHSELILIADPGALRFRSLWRERFEFQVDSDKKKSVEGKGMLSYFGNFCIKGSLIDCYTLNVPHRLPFPKTSVLIFPKSRLGKVEIKDFPRGKSEYDFEPHARRKAENDPPSPTIELSSLTQEAKDMLCENPPQWLVESAQDDNVETRKWLDSHVSMWLAAQVSWTFCKDGEHYLVSGD